MKRSYILTSLLLAFAFSSFGQSYKEIRKKEKEHQVKADTSHFQNPFEFMFIDSALLSKEQLFSKINTWVPTVFKNTNLSITKDTTSGKFVLARVESGYSSAYSYNLTIDVRNGKYRFAFTNFNYKANEYYTYSLDDPDKIKTVVIGQSKKSYWNNERLYLKEEAEAVFLSAKKYIEAKDDF